MTARKTNLIKQRVDHITEELDRCRVEYRRASDTIDELHADINRQHRKNERMVEVLEELLDYFQDQYDTVDDDNCQPMPNRAMKWGQAIEEALGRGGRYG